MRVQHLLVHTVHLGLHPLWGLLLQHRRRCVLLGHMAGGWGLLWRLGLLGQLRLRELLMLINTMRVRLHALRFKLLPDGHRDLLLGRVEERRQLLR